MTDKTTEDDEAKMLERVRGLAEHGYNVSITPKWLLRFLDAYQAQSARTPEPPPADPTPLDVAARVASRMGAPSPERQAVDICQQRVQEKKLRLDNALAEYAMACQTLAIAIDRADRASELPTEPQHEKPDAIVG